MSKSQEDTSQNKMGMLLIDVFKKLGLPCDLAVGITAIVLQTEMQRVEMAIWMWDNQVLDQEKIVRKALELAT